jgi:hypothetical protein
MSRSAATISAKPANGEWPEFRVLAQLSNLPRKTRSTQVLVRFFLRTGVLVIFAAYGTIGFDRSLAALLLMSVVFSAVIGSIRREPPFDIVLNHWDEALGYAALFSLVSIFNPSVTA